MQVPTNMSMHENARKQTLWSAIDEKKVDIICVAIFLHD